MESKFYSSEGIMNRGAALCILFFIAFSSTSVPQVNAQYYSLSYPYYYSYYPYYYYYPSYYVLGKRAAQTQNRQVPNNRAIRLEREGGQ